jgi:hypothetical protein
MVISVKFGGTGYFETNQLLLATVHFFLSRFRGFEWMSELEIQVKTNDCDTYPEDPEDPIYFSY